MSLHVWGLQEQDAGVRVPVRGARRGLVRARAAAVAGRRRAAPQRAELRRHRAGAQPAPQVLLHLPRQAPRVYQAAQGTVLYSIFYYKLLSYYKNVLLVTLHYT